MGFAIYEIERLLEEYDLVGDLDELVVDAKVEEADDINSKGVHIQLAYLITHMGTEALLRKLAEIASEGVVECKFCEAPVFPQVGYRRGRGWVCPQCWDERLRAT